MKKCTKCGVEKNGCQKPFAEEKPATEDHIIPIGEGLGRTEENIQSLCKSCNTIKGTHSMEYFLNKLKKEGDEE